MSRLLLEKITHDKRSNNHIAKVVAHMASLATETDSRTKCNIKNCRKTVCAALVAYKGRRFWITLRVELLLTVFLLTLKKATLEWYLLHG